MDHENNIVGVAMLLLIKWAMNEFSNHRPIHQLVVTGISQWLDWYWQFLKFRKKGEISEKNISVIGAVNTTSGYQPVTTLLKNGLH